jgi:hypothetical protein
VLSWLKNNKILGEGIYQQPVAPFSTIRGLHPRAEEDKRMGKLTQTKAVNYSSSSSSFPHSPRFQCQP